MILLPAVHIAKHVSYSIVVLQGCWVIPEERFDSIMRHHLRTFRGVLNQLEQMKRELLKRDDVMRLVLRGRGFLGHLRLEGKVGGQNVATVHDVWLLYQGFADQVNKLAPATPSPQARYSLR